jgi:hypothetical protein
MFLTQATPLDRPGGTGFTVNAVAKMSGVGQIVLDRLAEAIIHTVFTSSGQMTRDKYKRHTEWRGKRFGGEYQGNA